MRYDATSPREYTDRNGDKKTSWVRVGTAFEKDGRISVLLDAYPLPGPDGTAKIVLMEPRDNQRRAPQRQERDNGQSYQRPDDWGDDDRGPPPF